MFDAVLEQVGRRELGPDDNLGAAPEAATNPELDPGGVVEWQVDVNHIISRDVHHRGDAHEDEKLSAISAPLNMKDMKVVGRNALT